MFSDAGEAASLLQVALPDAVRNSFDWKTLTLVEGTFIDEGLRESQSDLLYEVRHIGTGKPVSIYMLFEHQSSSDPWIRLRLLRYCCRIWEDDLRDSSNRLELRPIVPVVFYQGERGWNYSTEFADLFPEAARSWPWVPRFSHELMDQTTLEPEAVAGGIKGRIAQLLMMVAFGRNVEAALHLTAQLLPLLDRAGGGINERHRFYLYLMATQDLDVIQTFREVLRRQGLDGGEDIMTYAQQLLAEGEAKGRAEGEARKQVEMVEGFLRVGVTWEIIEAATGLTETSFQALKAQLSGADS